MSIVVTTVKRPASLSRCLDALEALDPPVDEVIVVHHGDDAPTLQAINSRSGITSVVSGTGGMLGAMNAGADVSSCELIGFIDDDTEPHPDWWGKLASHFASPTTGAAGGRDIVAGEAEAKPSPAVVGRISRWGHMTGNHHLGAGRARRVDVLKGANHIYRREALALPVGMRGTDTQANTEAASCLWAINRGWDVIYDPSACVDHEAARRYGKEQRTRPTPSVISDSAYNHVASVVSQRPRSQLRVAIYGLLVGNASTVGVSRWLLAVLSRDTVIAARLLPSLAGQIAAHRSLWGSRRATAITMREFR